MSLEAATNIAQLNSSNPVSNDQVQQGDDHIRMLKSVLQFCFPNATKAFYFPITTIKSANFTILATEQATTYLVNCTAGIVTATLPTLAAGDAGWECSFVKTDVTTNTMFIAPPSGTIQSGEITGLAKTRRCIPGRKTRVFWTGTAYIAERVISDPIGSIIENQVSALPVGFELANGQTLGANYPDFLAKVGTGITFDCRGRTGFGVDGGAGRLGTFVAGTIGGTGGAETSLLIQSNLPNVGVGGTCSGSGVTGAMNSNQSHSHQYTTVNNSHNTITSGGQTTYESTQTSNTNSANIDHSHNFNFSGSIGTNSINGGVAQTVFNNMPPAYVVNKFVVVE